MKEVRPSLVACDLLTEHDMSFKLQEEEQLFYVGFSFRGFFFGWSSCLTRLQPCRSSVASKGTDCFGLRFLVQDWQLDEGNKVFFDCSCKQMTISSEWLSYNSLNK